MFNAVAGVMSKAKKCRTVERQSCPRSVSTLVGELPWCIGPAGIPMLLQLLLALLLFVISDAHDYNGANRATVPRDFQGSLFQTVLIRFLGGAVAWDRRAI